MTSVAIECSTDTGSVAARSRSGALLDASFDARLHAFALLDELARLLATLGESPASIARLFVGTGPGSYTGLRVAIATVLGLARGSGAPVYALSSYEALAWRELAPGAEATIRADARAGKLYHARYRRTSGDVEVLQAPMLIERGARSGPREAPERIFTENALARELGTDERLASTLDGEARPRAGALLELGEARLARGTLAPAELVEPLYLRSFEALERRR